MMIIERLTTDLLSFDCTIRVWDVYSGDTVHTIKESFDIINCIVLSNDGRTLACGGHDSIVRIYSTETFREAISIDCGAPVWRLCYADQTTLLAGLVLERMVAIDTSTGKITSRYAKHGAPTGIAVMRK